MEEKEGEEGGGRKGRRGRKQPQPHSQLGQHIGYLHSHSLQQDNQLFCTQLAMARGLLLLMQFLPLYGLCLYTRLAKSMLSCFPS